MAVGCPGGCRVSSWRGDRVVNWKGKRPRGPVSFSSLTKGCSALSPPAMQLDGSPERLTLAQGTRAGKATSPVCGKGAGLGATWGAVPFSPGSQSQRSKALQPQRSSNVWVSSAQSKTGTRIAEPPRCTRSLLSPGTRAYSAGERSEPLALAVGSALREQAETLSNAFCHCVLLCGDPWRVVCVGSPAQEQKEIGLVLTLWRRAKLLSSRLLLPPLRSFPLCWHVNHSGPDLIASATEAALR